MDLLGALRAALAAHQAVDLPPHPHRRAAVLVPVFEAGGVVHLLFTRRTETVEHHRGQISFPGGGEEPGDDSLLETALRETYEELGIDPATVEVWGRLDEVETVVSGFAVTPFVGRIPPPTGLRPNPNEIAEVIVVALEAFTDASRMRVEQVVRDGRPRELLFYDTPAHVIWGATARIVRSLVALLAAGPTPGRSPKEAGR